MSNDKFPESIWCSVGTGKDKILIGVCYRPPDSTQENDQSLIELVNKASKEKILIMGDFNFRELRWNDETLFDSSDKFVKCVNDNFLFQKTNKATRGENILDLIFVSDTDMVNQLDVGEPFETSDHNIIRFDLQVHEDQKDTPMKTIYNY